MRIAFFGTPGAAVPYLAALMRSPHEVCVVVTQPDRVAGRGRELRPPAVKSAAQARALCLLQPETCRAEEFTEAFRACRPEIGVVVAYGQILPPSVLACPPRGCLNVHYSLLPALRGAAPVQQALLQGLDETGVTVQWMAEQLDAGDIVLQERVPVESDDNQTTLFERMATVGVPLLLKALELIEVGEAPRAPQDSTRATWAPELTAEQCRIDWSRSAEEIRDLVRACHPKPGAYTYRRGRRLKVVAVEVVREIPASDEGHTAGHVELDSTGRLVVKAGNGAVALVGVQPEGRRAMSGAEHARGARFSAGEKLE